ncbi:MAG: endonuclease/exonuclease/phosphatase family protein [Planctomycetes bacterium]|nr:endonuclease/exonuclease/phosphatase family protein [Planctomycetota bacterium]
MATAPTAAAVSPSWRRPVALIDAAAVLLCLFTLAGGLGRHHWLLDLCAHFRGYNAAVAIIIAMALLLRRRRGTRWRLVPWASVAVALSINGIAVAPYYLPPADTATAANGNESRLLTFNVWTGNRKTSAVVDYLRDRAADFVFVLEIDQRWSAALQSLRDLYPHQTLEPADHNFGIGFLSRRPAQVRVVSSSSLPAMLVADVDVDGRPLRLIGVHTLPPIGRERHRLRDEQFDVVAQHVDRDGPTIVAGDLNATPWSSPFVAFGARTGLRDSGLGRGLPATWNAGLPVPGLPIDHVLVPRAIAVVDRRVGPDLGSDHRPLEVGFVWR